jgi:mycofactocin precursor
MQSDTITAQTTEPVDLDPSQDAAEAPLVEEELLVEEVSIDGMCGVY